MIPLRRRSLILIIFALCLTACTARVEHGLSSPAVVPAPRDAININIATIEELASLPTIGPKTAESIVIFRESNGPFRRVEHIMLIRGISEERFLKIREFIRAD